MDEGGSAARPAVPRGCKKNACSCKVSPKIPIVFAEFFVWIFLAFWGISRTCRSFCLESEIFLGDRRPNRFVRARKGRRRLFGAFAGNVHASHLAAGQGSPAHRPCPHRGSLVPVNRHNHNAKSARWEIFSDFLSPILSQPRFFSERTRCGDTCNRHHRNASLRPGAEVADPLLPWGEGPEMRGPTAVVRAPCPHPAVRRVLPAGERRPIE